jgi:hypothetical protein
MSAPDIADGLQHAKLTALALDEAPLGEVLAA